MSTKKEKLSKLIKETSFPRGPQPGPDLFKEVEAYIAVDGDLCLATDKPHGLGYSRQVLFFKMEDAPKVAELILGIYNEQREREREPKEAAS